jgi:multifunctional methyltransferase subunit TRM112
MRLLTHNLMMCNRKQCSGGFPLRIAVRESKTTESEFNPSHIKAMLGRIDYEALLATATSLGLNTLPPSYTDADLSDEMFLRSVHEVIMDYQVEEGDLICPKCERKFPVHMGIPNMLLHDDEV